MKYRALVAREAGDGAGFTCSVEELDTAGLPEGDLLIRVDCSSLNYKDALSANGNRGVTKRYPHTPGIDACGVVAESRSSDLREGDRVIVTGYDLGMNIPGGFGEYIRVPDSWAVRLPGSLDGRQAMSYGTAGLTAAIALERLEAAGARPEAGTAVVTGATGGVGGFATALLSKVGYEVEAVTGKKTADDYLRSLGAASVLGRTEIDGKTERPLLHARWATGVDTVGGPVLSNILKSIAYGGAVAACGNVAGGEFDATVYPFILRGISLMGVDSAGYPSGRREGLWERLGGQWNVLEAGFSIEVIGLDGLPTRIAEMLHGGLTGRVVVDLNV